MIYFINESLRQNVFWLRILMEHALFIRLGLPCEEESLRREAGKLEIEFGKLFKEALRLQKQCPNEKTITRLNNEAIDLATEIIDFKSRVLKAIICCKITTGFNYPLLIDHIRREAIYFRAALVRLNQNIMVGPVEMLLQDETFWMRIMAEHSKFIAHLLDPSERGFVRTARNFGQKFDNLRLHAGDWESMLVPQSFENSLLNDTEDTMRPKVFGKGLPEPYSTGALERFTHEAIAATKDLEAFKRAASNLIADCRLLSIIPPLLADHVLREAVRAVEDLNLRQKMLPSPCNDKAGIC